MVRDWAVGDKVRVREVADDNVPRQGFYGIVTKFTPYNPNVDTEPAYNVLDTQVEFPFGDGVVWYNNTELEAVQ